MNANQRPVLVGKLVEYQEAFSNLTVDEGQWVIRNPVEAISLFVEAVKNRPKKMVGDFFRHLGLTATIPPTTGKKTISGAEEIFTGYLDPEFKGWGLDVLGEVKPETPVESLELAKDGTFNDFFTSLGDLNKLVMTDEQIIWVVENCPDLLVQQDGKFNFFLKKKGDKFFVARVNRFEGRLKVFARRLSFGCVWYAECGLRVVVPQL
jgi:hypothetical protein